MIDWKHAVLAGLLIAVGFVSVRRESEARSEAESYRELSEALLKGKPYFGPALESAQGFASRHQYFLPALKRSRASGDILEIGSWAGASAVIWAAALKSTGSPGRLVCVDPWLPYFDLKANGAKVYAAMNHAAERGLVLPLFRHNLRAAGVTDIVDVRIGTSKQILPAIPDASFALIYIDGSHAFEDVLYDIQQAKRLIKPGGAICGDDLERQAKDMAPETLAADVQSGRDYIGYHPGVTAAVAKELTSVTVWDGFWMVEY